MLTILGWLWKNPNPDGPHYTPWHANVWARSIHRNLTLPHRFILATDTPEADFDPLITPIALWDDWRGLACNWPDHRGNCYPRLKAFSEEAREIIGARFVSIDLDLVVLGNTDSSAPPEPFLDPIFDRKEDFLILKRFLRSGADPKNWCQGSMWMMTAGARARVWTEFTGRDSVAATKGMLGTDQAWLAHKLSPDEAGWSEKDGVVCWLDLNNQQKYLEPPAVKMIFFNTSWDQKPDYLSKPIRARERAKVPWIARFYQ